MASPLDRHEQFIRDRLEDSDSQKAEALQWLESSQGKNTLGELDSAQDSMDLVKAIYAAGAEAVIAIEIADYDGEQNSGKLIIKLPKDKAHRARVFEWHTTDALSRWKKCLLATTAGVAVVASGVTGSSMPYVRSASPMAQVGGPAFEVISVTPNKSGDTRGGCCRLESGGRLMATNATLRELIQSAYQRHAFDRREMEGGPPWIDSERFDLVAQAAGEHAIDSDGLPRQTWLMLRTLLADRFKLRVRIESRNRPIYALVMAGSGGHLGPRLRRSEIDCAAVTAMFIKGQRPEKPACASASYPGRLVATALTLPSVASILSGSVDRVVIDHTGLTGTFDLELEAVEIRPPGPFGPSYRPSDTKQSILMALPQQLGLKLQAKQGTVDVLVIESAEQPTPGNP